MQQAGIGLTANALSPSALKDGAPRAAIPAYAPRVLCDHENETSPQQAAGYQKEGHWR